jgi:hypothetical protein
MTVVQSNATPSQHMGCALCGRVVKRGTTDHHLIPRTCHSNRWFKQRFSREEMQRTIPLCGDCHRAVHDLIPDEKALGRHYNTPEKLAAHPKIARFLAWICKQK